MGTTNTLDLNNRVDKLEKAVSGGGGSAQANKADIATEFSATTAYTAGCFVYYGGKLYQFNADHAAGAWDPTDVVESNVTDQIVSNKSALDGLTASDVAYDNTDSWLTATDVQGAVDELADSYPASKVMMSDGVTSVEDRLDSANLSGNTYVDISSYNSISNYYTCPSDGYIRLYGTSSTVARLSLISKDGTSSQLLMSTKELYSAVFVRKGAKVFCENANSTIFFLLT